MEDKSQKLQLVGMKKKLPVLMSPKMMLKLQILLCSQFGFYSPMSNRTVVDMKDQWVSVTFV